MTRDIRSSRGPRKIQYPGRTRRKVHAKDKGKARTVDDVYEYAPSKVRRAKVALSLDRHEIEGRRYGSEDDMDVAGLGQQAMEKLRARLIRDDEGEDADGRVDSEDDEEIDSEDAFEESDKDGFAGSEFVRKGVKPGRGRALGKRRAAKEVDLDEDSDARSRDSRSVSESEDENGEIDEGGSGEFFDILDVFDGRADLEDDGDAHPKVDKRPQDPQTKDVAVGDEAEWEGAQDPDVGMTGDGSEDEDRDEDEEEGGEEGDEDEEEEGSASDEDDALRISASDSEGPSPEALADLKTFLSNLDPTAAPKRKSDDVVDPGPKKRRRVTDRTEAGEESEFGVRGSSTLKLDDLLAPLASSDSLAALKKSTKPLTSSSSKTKTLSAPLHQRAQERLDREAAYEQTKEEVDKWSATMKRIKEAEHLSFPLQAEKPSRVSNLELAAKFTPSNELECAVDKLLKSAQLRDEDIPHTEALKMAHLSVEEVAARRAELRMMRELAFRADKKAKRIAKIKSKTYRRIRKKQRERLDGAGEGTDQGGDGEDDEERLKAEVQRARERATLRHKNTGKWAKAMKGREGLDQDQRQAIGEMLERGEKLRRRIRGENSDDDGSEDGESGGEEQDEEEIKRDAFEELAALRTEKDTAPTDLSSKSVFNMKFMRDAAARKAQVANAQAEELQREMGFGMDGEEEDETDATMTSPKDATLVQRTGGRLSFRPGAAPGTLKSFGSLASDTSSVTLQSADLLQDILAPEPTPTPSLSTPTPTSTSAPLPNPWLLRTASSGPSQKRNEVRVHKDANASTKSSNKLKKQTGKHADERERARDDAVLEIDVNNVLTIPEPSAPSAPAKKSKGKGREGVAKTSAGPSNTSHDEGEGDDESDVPSEVEEQERAEEGKNPGKGIREFQQRDLVALAFAGDNVVQAFEEAKRQETEADAPREVDTTLPGWGTWGGTGTEKRKNPAPKPHLIKTLPGIAPTARLDRHKPHLIVSEKRDKKAAKYLVRELPYPYTSHAQFERRMDVPLGTEWNTRVGFQRGTMPHVVKKMGTVIDPLEKLF